MLLKILPKAAWRGGCPRPPAASTRVVGIYGDGSTMRVFLTTSVSEADRIFQEGFTDRHYFGEDGVGVFLSDTPLDANDGFKGPVTLCLEIPDDVFKRHEREDAGAGFRYAIPPAALVNGLGPPR